MYKGSLQVPLRWAFLEFTGSRLEVYVTPQPPGKLLGVEGRPVDVTVQLCKGQQCEGPARLTGSKCHVALDRVYLQCGTSHCIVLAPNPYKKKEKAIRSHEGCLQV